MKKLFPINRAIYVLEISKDERRIVEHDRVNNVYTEVFWVDGKVECETLSSFDLTGFLLLFEYNKYYDVAPFPFLFCIGCFLTGWDMHVPGTFPKHIMDKVDNLKRDFENYLMN